MEIRIGTSGYTYRHWWDNVFYPKDLPPSKWLQYYQKFFDTVELNVTFYRLPLPKTFISWEKRTLPNFLFYVKGSRVITHFKKLKEVEKALEVFFNNVALLKKKVGVILWQFPPSFKKDLSRLNEFIDLMGNKGYLDWRHTFEFRHSSWFTDDVFQVLKEHNIALCIAHSKVWPCVEEITANFLYLRFHGGEILYGSEYSLEELKNWSEKIKKWMGGKEALFAYFNNDFGGFAVKNALMLKKLLGVS